MTPMTRVFLLDDAGERFFGEGPCRLLRGIEVHGSLRASAQSMGMAYTKAMRLMKHAEETLGYPLTRKTIGGRGGGGSELTEEGKEIVRKYEEYRDRCMAANRGIFEEIFGGFGAAASDPDR